MSSVKSKFSRSLRLNAFLHKELAAIMHNELSDPRLQNLSIINVVLSNDFQCAKISVDSVTWQTQKHIAEGLVLINHASGFLRSCLACVSSGKNVPKLFFIYEKTYQSVATTNELLEFKATSY